MEVDKPEDSSSGDTPEAVGDPAVPVIPDAEAGAAQEAEVPAASPAKKEVDKPEELKTGEAPKPVADPAVPVVPGAGAGASQAARLPHLSDPEAWGNREIPTCNLDFKVDIEVPPEDPAEPVAGPSRRKAYLRRALVEDEISIELRSRRRQAKESMEMSTPCHHPYCRLSKSCRLGGLPEPIPSKSQVPIETIDISDDTTEPDPQVSAEPQDTPDQDPQAAAEPKPRVPIETIYISDDTTDPDAKPSAEPKPGPSGISGTPDMIEASVELKTGSSGDYIDVSDMPGYAPFVFIDYIGPVLESLIRQKHLILANSPPPNPDSTEHLDLCEKMQRKILPDDDSDDSPEPELAEPAPVEEVQGEGTSKQSHPASPLVSWHPFLNPIYHREPDTSRPTTPTVEDNSPISDLMYLDEDALLEPPSETLAEASLEEVSAMETSKPSSPASTGSKRSQPASIGTSRRSPPASIDDVSKDTSYTVDTLKPSPPASTDTSKISPPASVDVSKDKTAMDEDAQLEALTGTLQDEDAQLEPPTGKSVEARLKEFSAVDIPKMSPSSSGDDSKGTSSTMGTSKRSPATPIDDVSKDKSSILEEARSRESTEHEEVQKTPPLIETVLGIEAPSGFLARLSPMVQSPQRSPQRVPGVSKLSSAAASRDASRQSTSSSVALGTSRKRLLERDEDDEPPTVYRAIDESDETVEYETRRTLATVLSELEDSSRQSAVDAALQDASRQSSLSAASMTMSGEKSLTKAVARQTIADVISQVEEPSLGVISMDDASKGTTSTFEEEIYMQPDTFAVAEDSRSRQSAKDEEVKGPTLYETLLANEAKAGILPRVPPAVQPSQPGRPVPPDESSGQSSSSAASGHAQFPGPAVPAERAVSRSPEAMEVDEAAQPGAPEILVREAAQPSPPRMLVDQAARPFGPQVVYVGPQPVRAEVRVDSPQPGPSGISAQRKKPVFVSSDESSLSNESSSDLRKGPSQRKTLKVFGTRLYLSSLPEDEVEELSILMKAASATFQVLNNGNAPFSFFVDHFGAIITNQYIMFELVKASENQRPALYSELEYQSKSNYTTMLKIERLIKLYTDEKDLNPYLRGVLKYIEATVHELDTFNHAIYRHRGVTSLHSRISAESIWQHVVKLQEKNISVPIRKKKNAGSVSSEYVNKLENARLQTGFYQNFYDTYKALRELMQYLRKRYMPEGVVFSMDDLPGLRHAKDHFTMELAVVLPADMLVTFLQQDVVNHRIVMDRSAMIEYVRLYVSRLFQTEDNFSKLFRHLVNRIPRRQEPDEEEDSDDVQTLKEILFRDYKRLVDELKKIGPFNFLIEEMLDVLAKSLDLLLCLNKFAENLAVAKQELRRMVRGGPEETEHRRQFDDYAAEIKCVVAGLQQYVYKKIMIMQIKLRNIKNDLYGGAYNSFVDLLRVKIHELDRINTDRSIYESPEYISYTGKTNDDVWAVKVNEVYRHLEPRFRYKGQTPLEKLPDAERSFIQKQLRLYSDNTYRASVRLLLALCTALGNLEVNFRVKIEEIMNYTTVTLDDDDEEDDDAVAVDDVAVDEAAAVAVDMAAVAVDEAAAVAVDVAAVAIDVADAAVVAVDVADAAAAVVDVTDAAAAVVDVADAATAAVVVAVADVADVPAPAVGKVDGAVDVTDAPSATVDIAASSASDDAEDL